MDIGRPSQRRAWDRCCIRWVVRLRGQRGWRGGRWILRFWRQWLCFVGILGCAMRRLLIVPLENLLWQLAAHRFDICRRPRTLKWPVQNTRQQGFGSSETEQVYCEAKVIFLPGNAFERLPMRYNMYTVYSCRCSTTALLTLGRALPSSSTEPKTTASARTRLVARSG